MGLWDFPIGNLIWEIFLHLSTLEIHSSETEGNLSLEANKYILMIL